MSTLTTPDGDVDQQAVEAAAQAEVAAAPWITLADARRRWQAAAEFARDDIAERREREAERAARATHDEARAQALAERHGYDTVALLYQINRRAFGSFSTTRERYALPLYRRAYAIAHARREAREAIARAAPEQDALRRAAE